MMRLVWYTLQSYLAYFYHNYVTIYLIRIAIPTINHPLKYNDAKCPWFHLPSCESTAAQHTPSTSKTTINFDMLEGSKGYVIKKKYVPNDFDKEAIFRYVSSNIEYTNQRNNYRLLTFQILIGSKLRNKSENTLIYSRIDNNICFVLAYQNLLD